MKDRIMVYGIHGRPHEISATNNEFKAYFGEPDQWPEIRQDRRIPPGMVRYFGSVHVLLVPEGWHPGFLMFPDGVTDESLDIACKNTLTYILNCIERM